MLKDSKQLNDCKKKAVKQSLFDRRPVFQFVVYKHMRIDQGRSGCCFRCAVFAAETCSRIAKLVKYLTKNVKK
jgi:hypothetical protein